MLLLTLQRLATNTWFTISTFNDDHIRTAHPIMGEFLIMCIYNHEIPCSAGTERHIAKVNLQNNVLPMSDHRNRENSDKHKLF